MHSAITAIKKDHVGWAVRDAVGVSYFRLCTGFFPYGDPIKGFGIQQLMSRAISLCRKASRPICVIGEKGGIYSRKFIPPFEVYP